VPRRHDFGGQLAVVTPEEAMGGRFDGAGLSPGFGVLYLSGYTATSPRREGCGGYFGEEPEHVLEVRSEMPVKLVILESDGAVVLGVSGPDGSLSCWEEDSLSNANVALSQRYAPGRYEVWVGPRNPQTLATYRLALSE
jgi:hypothetical protein